MKFFIFQCEPEHSYNLRSQKQIPECMFYADYLSQYRKVWIDFAYLQRLSYKKRLDLLDKKYQNTLLDQSDSEEPEEPEEPVYNLITFQEKCYAKIQWIKENIYEPLKWILNNTKTRKISICSQSQLIKPKDRKIIVFIQEIIWKILYNSNRNYYILFEIQSDQGDYNFHFYSDNVINTDWCFRLKNSSYKEYHWFDWEKDILCWKSVQDITRLFAEYPEYGIIPDLSNLITSYI